MTDEAGGAEGLAPSDRAAAGPDRSRGLRTLVARAPGRVNLLGDHTDYNEGLALPMAIDLRTRATFTENDSGYILLYTALDSRSAEFPIDVSLDGDELGAITPGWAALAAAVASQARPVRGGIVRITSSLPTGAGLASSAAYAVSLAVVFGVDVPPAAFAHLCQRAEAAVGIDVGLMDPMVVAGARRGHAMLIDFSTLGFDQVGVPEGAEVVVVHSGQGRQLVGTPYAARRAECEAAALELGAPLGRAERADLPGILDPVLRRRTRHVVSECERVRAFAAAFADGDLPAAGRVMMESHLSLARDFECSTREVDDLVELLTTTRGVHGARMTGGGFGGCVVALAEPGVLDVGRWPGRAWRVTAAGGATLEVAPVRPTAAG
ncbi:MAG: galactokinase [Acidimicrobiales bacterium]